MRAIRSRDTAPEIAVRTLVHGLGLRYRVHTRPVASVPRLGDLVFSRARVVVFIDGCFWHGCPEHSHPVRVNTEYWGPKLERNAQRDADTDRRLREAGWTVLRFWAHESAEAVAHSIADCVREAMGPSI